MSLHCHEVLILIKIQIDSGVPYLLLFNNTGSKGVSLTLNIFLMFMIFVGNVTALAACAREMWAFARDKGLPFSRLIGKMYVPVICLLEAV